MEKELQIKDHPLNDSPPLVLCVPSTRIFLAKAVSMVLGFS